MTRTTARRLVWERPASSHTAPRRAARPSGGEPPEQARERPADKPRARSPSASPPSGQTSPAPAAPLFRREAIEARRTQWLGVVLLEPRLSHRLFGWCGIAICVGFAVFILIGSYTRKVRVVGWLVPQQGLATVSASLPGSVSKVSVKEGQSVRKGDPLITISGDLRSEAGASRAAIVEQARRRKNSLSEERDAQARMLESEEATLRRQVDTLTAQVRHTNDELALQKERLALAQRSAQRARQMRAQDLIALPRLEQSEKERLDQSERTHALERALSTARQDLATARTALEQFPLKRATQLGAVERNLAAAEQELIEADFKRAVVLTAPTAGIVSGIRTEVGSDVTANAPLLNITPEGSKLQAQLFAVSRAIGFVRPGQTVQVRYQAYPYQKFGLHRGTVVDVSHSAISPSELNRALTGVSSLYPANEPLYRVVVKLEKDSVSAYGEAMPLRAGMQLEADVMVDHRQLFEWMLDPLYTITGR